MQRLLRGQFRGQFRRQVGSTLLAQLASLVLIIANSAIIARWLGPEGKGALTLAMLVPAVLSLLLGLGIGVANAFFAGSRRFETSQLTRNSVGLGLILSGAGLVFTAIVSATGLLGRLLPGVPAGVMAVTMAAFPLILLTGYFTATLQGLQRIYRVNLVTLWHALAQFGLTVLLVVVFGLGLTGGALAYAGAALAGLLMAMHFLAKEGASYRPALDAQVVRPALAFGLRGYVGNVLQFFNYRLDAFLVNYYLGPAGVGIYSVSVALAEMLWYLPNAVSFVIFPRAARSRPEEMNTFTPRVFRATMGLTALGGLALAGAGQFLIVLIYGEAFAAAYGPLLALLPGVVLLGGAKVLTNEIAGRGYPIYNSVASGLGLVLTVILDLALIPRLGVLGAAVASSLAYAAIFVVAIFFYGRVSRQAGAAPPG
jgi:O-antigen/teichoic acid export membrane protein